MSTILIRPYKPSDRKRVRTLCCDTGDIGEPCDYFFPDRELFADMWSAYYTDNEPEHCWVAEVDGEVRGYVLSCFQESRFKWKQFLWILPKAGLQALLRGSFFTKEMRTLIWKNIVTPAQGQEKKFVTLTSPHGHVHANIDHRFRGKKLGEQLLQVCLQQAQSANLKWLTAGVRGDNLLSQSFFQKQGFIKVAEHSGFCIPERSATRVPIVEYGYKFK